MDAACKPRLELELEAEPNSVRRARQAARALADEVRAAREDVALAVSEAVGNAVVHAYADRSPGTVRVLGTVDAGRLVIEVSDRGNGFRPHLEGRGLGMGITLISQLASEVRFRSSRDGASVWMAFPVGVER